MVAAERWIHMSASPYNVGATFKKKIYEYDLNRRTNHM
jgi:hypothetical protein